VDLLMRTALLLSGHLRTYKECLKSHESNILSVLNPDVFVHTWDETEAKNHHNSDKAIKVSDDDVHNLQKVYSPVNYKIETQNLENIENYHKLAECNVAKSMFRVYSMMKEHENDKQFKYDLIVRLRPDIFIVNKITDEYSDLDEMEVLYYGNLSHNGPVSTTDECIQKFHNYRALDCFNFSTKQSAPFVHGIYPHIETYLNKDKYRHGVLLDYALDNGVKPVISDNFVFDVDWYIKRYE
tara:strand:+ start:259 stop:978 length:720 start_codon:yes stop_codon:yes gene_type:complete